MGAKSRKTANAVVIGAGVESIHAIRKAKEMGISVIALDGNPHAEGLRYADEGFTVDIRNLELIYAILDRLSPEVVIPVPIGRYLTSVGAVNDRYGLCGVSHQAAGLCTDKHSFHKALARGKNRETGHVLISAGEARPIPLAFPVVAKPRYGSGSAAVRIYKDENDLLSELPLDEDFVIEGLVKGTEYGVDAAVINGVLRLVLLREKQLTPYPYCQCIGYFSVAKDNENTPLFNAAEKALGDAARILGLNNCLLHADLIYNGGNDVFLIEISARPSGHNLHNLFTPMTTGIDMIAEYLKFALPRLNSNYSFSPPHTRRMLIRYFNLSVGRVVRVPSKEYLCGRYPIRAYECTVKEGDKLSEVTDGRALMSRGYYVVEGKDKNELMAISNQIEKSFVVEE